MHFWFFIGTTFDRRDTFTVTTSHSGFDMLKLSALSFNDFVRFQESSKFFKIHLSFLREKTIYKADVLSIQRDGHQLGILKVWAYFNTPRCNFVIHYD